MFVSHETPRGPHMRPYGSAEHFTRVPGADICSDPTGPQSHTDFGGFRAIASFPCPVRTGVAGDS